MHLWLSYLLCYLHDSSSPTENGGYSGGYYGGYSTPGGYSGGYSNSGGYSKLPYKLWLQWCLCGFISFVIYMILLALQKMVGIMVAILIQVATLVDILIGAGVEAVGVGVEAIVVCSFNLETIKSIFRDVLKIL